jgi:hypothetical protein
MRVFCAVALVASIAHATTAYAQQAEARTSRSHYDHREPEDHTADEAWRWVPRVVLAPFALALSLFREPARLVLEPFDPPEGSEGAPWIILPVVHLETEVSPAVGAWLAYTPDDALSMNLSIAHWDDARIEGRARATLDLDGSTIGIDADTSTRRDRIFHGTGASTPSDRRRYAHHQGGGTLAWRYRSFFRSSELALSVRATHHRFDETDYGGEGEPTLRAQDVDGFDGATVIEPRLSFAIDSRAPLLGAGNRGLAIGMAAAVGTDVEHDAHWIRSEAHAGVTIPILREHDLTFGVWATSVDAIDGAIPFVELAILGGEPGRFAGFPPGRFFGHSAVVTTSRYRWSIDQRVDASLDFELGDVLGPRFEGFAIERSRLSVALSIDGIANDDHRFGLLVGMGTSPIDDGLTPESGHVRFFIGSPPR